MSFLSYEKIELFFSNFSFVCLFISMITFWFNLSGKVSQRQLRQTKGLQVSNSVQSATLGISEDGFYLPSIVGNDENSESSRLANNLKSLERNEKKNWGELGILTANLSLFVLLSLRWLESGHFPLSNLYESLMFLCWALTFFHICLQQSTANNFLWLGAITAPTALFTNAFANFSLPVEMQRASALVPALQSNWLMMHVTVMILSYAALIFGCVLSIGFLILTFSISSEEYEQIVSLPLPIQSKVNVVDSQVQLTKITEESKAVNNKNFLSSQPKYLWAQNLDNLSYRMLGIGFPLLTIGILSGAVWANEAWGSYWSWDPKETWALLTWLIFAIYLHTRITKNWQGKKPAMIASFGFFVVWVCYLGVNLLGEGLHSYGWLNS